VSVPAAPLPVTLDFTPALAGTGGIGRYTRELARALAPAGSGVDLRLFAAHPNGLPPLADFPATPRILRRMTPRAWRLDVAPPKPSRHGSAPRSLSSIASPCGAPTR
jgi:hypothetical protein